MKFSLLSLLYMLMEVVCKALLNPIAISFHLKLVLDLTLHCLGAVRNYLSL